MRHSKLLLVVSGIGACLLANATDTPVQQLHDVALNEPFLAWFFDVLQDMLISTCTQEHSQDPLGNDWRTCVYDAIGGGNPDHDTADAIAGLNLQPRAPLVVPASERPYPDQQQRLMGELADYFKQHPSMDPWRSQGGYAHVMQPFLNPYDALDEPCWGRVLIAPLETLSLAGFPGLDKRQAPELGHHTGAYLFTLPATLTRGRAVTSTELYAPAGTSTIAKTGTAVLHVKETQPPRWALTLDNGIGETATISASVKVDKNDQVCYETFFDAKGHSTTVTRTWHPAVVTATRSKRDVEDAEARTHRSHLTVGESVTRVAMVGHVPVTEIMTVTSSKPIRLSGNFYNDVEGLTGEVIKTLKSHDHTLTEEIVTYGWDGTGTQYTIHHPTPTINKRSHDDVLDVDALSKGQTISTVGLDQLFYPVTTSMTVFASKPLRASGFISNDLGYTETVSLTWKTKHHSVRVSRTIIASGRTFSTELTLPTPSASNMADIDNYSKGQVFGFGGIISDNHMVNAVYTVTETKPPRLSGHIIDQQQRHSTVYRSFKSHDHTWTAMVETIIAAGQTSSATFPLPTSHVTKRDEAGMEQATVTILDMRPGLSTLNRVLNGVAAGTITVIDLYNRELFATLVPTTDNQGQPIMQTVLPKATTTTITSWKKGQRTINKTMKQTVTITKTKNGGQGQASTVTAVITQTVVVTASGAPAVGAILDGARPLSGTTEFAVDGLPLPTYTATVGGVLALSTGGPIPAVCGSSYLASRVQPNATFHNQYSLRDLRARYPELDWNGLRIIAEQAYRINPGNSVEQYMVSGAHCLLAHPGAGHAFHPVDIPTPIVRNVSDIVKPTCNPKKDHTDKKQCKIDHCVWKHKRPMEFFTVFDAHMSESDNYTLVDYFSHTTSISDHPHWGSTDKGGTYYPLLITTTFVPGAGTSSTFAIRQTPDSVAHKAGIHGAPRCFDKQTCYDQCYREVHTSFAQKHKKVFLIVGPILLGLALLALLLCCCLPLLRRRRQQPSQQPARTSTVVRAVDPVTGQTVTQEVVSPATVAAGATGAATGSTVGGENAEKTVGQGTLGRQAEEGRGRVSFAPGSDQAAEKVVEAPAAAVPSGEHVETVVPAQHDGAADSRPTGVDVGSMRGRRRNRPQDLL